MSEEVLYRKVMKGKRTVYEAIVKDDDGCVTTHNLTDRQCLTVAGALGVTLLDLFMRNMPEHKKVYRKILALEDAIRDLYQGTGQPIDEPLADLFCRVWDKTMVTIDAGVEV